MSEQETREVLFEELRWVTGLWTVYEDIPKSQQARCRVIGTKLNALGGEALMREAYYDAKAANQAATVVQAYWDGIGDWRW